MRRVEVPLFDDAQAADVLTEAREVAFPPSREGNRFLRGWWPARRAMQPALLPEASGARLEIVHLASRPRRLGLALEVEGEAPLASLHVRAAGRDLGRFPIAATVEAPLPADLPLGRVPIDLRVEGDSEVALLRAGLSPALPAGGAAVEGNDLVQRGASLVVAVRPVEPGAVLSGRFRPPDSPAPGQRSRLLVEREGEPAVEALSWSPSRWSLFDRPREFRVPLETGGWVRIRFLAEGQGPAVRWENLRLVSPSGLPSKAPEPVQPPAPRVVILYVMDALRADYVGHLGGPPGISPTFDRLAAEGAAFTRHFSVAPNTTPSTKTLFTGRIFLSQGGWKLPADGPPTLAQRFAAAGYRTGLFSANGNVSQGFGLARGFERAPTRVLLPSPSRAGGPAYNDSAERVHTAALGWLAELSADQRAFLYGHTNHPHNPNDPPEPYRAAHTRGIGSRIDGSTETLLDLKHRRRDASGADQQRLRGLYAAGLAYNDAELACFLSAVLRRYPPDEVLVVVTSDHGEELFDHGGVLHGYTLYDEMLRIPLVFWWPGRIQPRRIDAGTDNADLNATLSAIAGPSPIEGAGRSLWHLLLGSPGPVGRHLHFAAASDHDGGIFMTRSQRYKLIYAPRADGEWGSGQGRGRSRDVEYVFDLAADPQERNNLAGEDLFEPDWLRSRLIAWLERGKEPAAAGAPEELDEATRENLEALGYIQ